MLDIHLQMTEGLAPFAQLAQFDAAPPRLLSGLEGLMGMKDTVDGRGKQVPMEGDSRRRSRLA